MRSHRWAVVSLGLLIAISGCKSGYVREDNRLVWVSYESGNPGGARSPVVIVDRESLVFLPVREFAKDKERVFYKGKEIVGADPETFAALNEDYSWDKLHVYLRQYRVADANPRSFKILDGFYSMDSQTAYCGTVPMKVDNLEAFQVIEGGNQLLWYTRDNQGLGTGIDLQEELENLDATMPPVLLYSNGIASAGEQLFDGPLLRPN